MFLFDRNDPIQEEKRVYNDFIKSNDIGKLMEENISKERKIRIIEKLHKNKKVSNQTIKTIIKKYHLYDLMIHMDINEVVKIISEEGKENIPQIDFLIPTHFLIYNLKNSISRQDQQIHDISKSLSNKIIDLKEKFDQKVDKINNSISKQDQQISNISNSISTEITQMKKYLNQMSDSLAPLVHKHSTTEIYKLDTNGKEETLDKLFDLKANVVHNHSISEISNLTTTLDSKANINHSHNDAYSSINHSHSIKDIQNYKPPDLSKYAKLDTTNSFQANQTISGTIWATKFETYNSDPKNSIGVTLRNSILNLIYPIGSVYITRTQTSNPSEIFGFGTWMPIQGYFLRAQNSNETLGSTGGELTHAHTYGIKYCGWYSEVHATHGDTLELRNDGNSWKHATNLGMTQIMHNGYGQGRGDATIFEIIANTSSTSSLPPYMNVCIWYRTN